MDWLLVELGCGRLCDACGEVLASARAHLKARGSGGDDLNNVALLCHGCHTRQEKRTAAFIKECGVNLHTKAIAHTQRYYTYLAHGGINF